MEGFSVSSGVSASSQGQGQQFNGVRFFGANPLDPLTFALTTIRQQQDQIAELSARLAKLEADRG